MEDKKIDINSVIGFIVIGLILVWMLYNNKSHSKNEENKLLKKDTTAVVVTPKNPNSKLQKIVTTPIYKDSLLSKKGEDVILENKLVFLNINTKGGQITQVQIKPFKSYNNKPIYLVNEGNSAFNINLITSDNKIIDTKNLFFVKSISQVNGNQVLSLKSTFENDSYIAFEYILKPNDYLVDFNIISHGFKNYINASKNPKMEWHIKGFRHAKSVQYENRYTMMSYRYEKDKVSELSASKDDDESVQEVQWISFRQHFFNSILVADTPFSKVQLSSKNLVKDEGEDVIFTKDFNAVLNLELQNGELQKRLHWYYGPTDYDVLKTYKKYNLSESMYLGWGIFGWLNKYIFIPLFTFLCSLVPHGIAIILLTILVRVLMSPATYKSYLSQAKMKVIQPEVAEINKKFEGKDLAVKRQQKTMELYRKAGVNPMSGCIPALLQLPVFYALFTFFPTAFTLRQKTFLWADDLSSYDVIFQLPFHIPFYGAHVSLFPLLASIAIFFYMTLTTGQTMQQQQPGMPNMKFLMYLSPLMMLFFFNNYASGLSLYYFISNLITIIIMLVIKNFIIDQDKIHAKIEENKKKPKKVSRFQQKVQDMMAQAEEQKKRRK